MCDKIGCQFWDALRLSKCARWNEDEGLLCAGAPKCGASEFSPRSYMNRCYCACIVSV